MALSQQQQHQNQLSSINNNTITSSNINTTNIVPSFILPSNNKSNNGNNNNNNNNNNNTLDHLPKQTSKTTTQLINSNDNDVNTNYLLSSSPSSSSPSFSTSPNNSLTKMASTNGKPNVRMRVMQNVLAPAWSVPPKVLLVDDDAIYQNIGSKLLQVFGCSFDIAVDGLSAVRKMNFSRYDLVLMDIVLPNLDGVEATAQIRRFDMTTPIISMTSNIAADDCFKYLSHGMNDILAKPFTKAHLLSMLERHCKHLKVIKTFQNIPRSIVIENSNNCTSSGENNNRIIEEISDNTNIPTGDSSSEANNNYNSNSHCLITTDWNQNPYNDINLDNNNNINNNINIITTAPYSSSTNTTTFTAMMTSNNYIQLMNNLMTASNNHLNNNTIFEKDNDDDRLLEDQRPRKRFKC